MYVYRTEVFNEQVNAKGLADKVDRLSSELATMSLEQVLARFERVYPYLKRKEGNKRLIARIRKVGEDYILCWLKVFRRGDHEYELFLRDRVNWANQPLDVNLTDNRLWQWLNEVKASQQAHHFPHPLSDELRPWLNRPSLSMDFNNVLVYESEAWVNQFATPDVQQHWRAFNSNIAVLVDAPQDPGQPTPWEGIQLYGDGSCWILYSRIFTTDDPPRQVLFLIFPFIHSPTDTEIEDLLGTFLQEAEITIFSPQTPITLDELTTVASRAYPSYLLADESNWLAIEKAENANLALSAEEEAILHGVSTTKTSLPLFLNGQAGSGKSTMLFHLFADYCHRHLSYCKLQQKSILAKPHPLFLAYNERLLRVAKERVIPLLASHYRFLAKRGESEDLPGISPFFKSFRTFLRNLLPLEERDNFNDANYISFHRFRQLFYRKLKSKYSAEVCWQVIRTFIKGYHLDERDCYLNSEDYKEIPRREQTVTVEEFEEIYETVWKWYSRYLKEEEKWDDQDLIRKVLNLKCYRPEYTAIFCDEAQDFTHLELQLIMKLSVFSNYDLEHQHIESLPFAFAGDPLQTLNPTGFRWASLKAAFYNEVITTLSPTGRLGLEMNFAELESNYRSTPAIVGVNNLIQLWRSVLFSIPELCPQKARRHGDFLPQKLILGRNTSLEELQDYLRDTIIIIPCDQGGEADYVQRDELLRTLQQVNHREKTPWNVLSAIAAKGLEFKQVVLYKFGEQCPPDIWNTIEGASEESKYFFNKLYVAASRATERLFIVDTENGETTLWRHASNPAELEQLLNSLPKHRQQWENRIQLIDTGDHAEALRGSDDLPSIAQTFASQGIEDENPDLLRRAQEAYLQLGDETQAARCDAWAQKFEENYSSAGEYFLKLGEQQEAWNCFWLGMDWPALGRWYQQQGSITETEGFVVYPEKVRPLVAFMATANPDFTAIWQFSEFLKTAIVENRLEDYRFLAQWKAAMQTYGDTVSNLIEQSPDISAAQWQQLGEVLQQLAAAQYAGMRDRAGYCFYYAQNYPTAVTCWEVAKSTKKPQYNLAKAELLGLPEGLSYLAKAKQYDRILTAWQVADYPETPDWLTGVATALEQQEDWKEAVWVYQVLGLPEKVNRCLEKAQQANIGESALQYLLEKLLHRQDWENTIDLLETHPNLLSTPQANESGFPFSIAKTLAYSELDPDCLSRDLRKRYERFLKEQIVFNPDWENYLTMQELGVALEKIGSLVETLTFYERYTHHEDADLQTFSRERWLATKQKQEQYLSKQGQVKKAVKSRSELHKKSQQWGISLDTISLPIPVPPTPLPATPPPPVEVQPTPTTPISGLPEGVGVESLQPDLLCFTLRHLQVKVLLNAQQVLIVDRLSDRTLRIDGKLQQVSCEIVTLQANDTNRLTFTNPQSQYNGVFYAQDSVLELTLPDLNQPIRIQL
ncbi:3'-5' exonuclease [Spirulina sp. CS-785/01]|uniref:3'-5' exonuclease n=1 Tax=Spirulina sp. CS-785/01 TaxID=3021716 RepID=UPI00232E0106|nr:3'-5' exonuclease [Spirulina sp. CS-785/01]MDB9315891.1 3'-5' exonuclease [Spirulina sp. CS-785/01]